VHPDVERTILHFYPRRELKSPVGDPEVVWDYDPSFQRLKAVLAELKVLDPGMEPSARSRGELSEEVVLLGGLRLTLSYLGPYAALNHGMERPSGEVAWDGERAIQQTLDRHGIQLLAEEALTEAVPWITRGRADVWACLFAGPA
jgi:hypothetical protein